MRFDFLDFSSIEKRRAACEVEVRLNRRLAGDVYLGVVPVTADATGRFSIDGEGVVVDWLVKMRRLPAAATLDRHIEKRTLTTKAVRAIGSRLIDFYQAQPAVTLDAVRFRGRLDSHVRANLAELSVAGHGLPTTQIRRIHAAQLATLHLETGLFDARMAAGRVIEGHGDLRPEHVYLVDPPAIIDAVEFNLEYRQLDIADELAFLAMELEILGRADVGEQLFSMYTASTGDEIPRRLRGFYSAYRACVRAKVLELRIDQVRPAEAEPLRAAVVDYLRLADRYAAEIESPRVVVVRGTDGHG